MKLLIVNPGSESKKYSLFVDRKVVFSAHFERTPKGFSLTTNLNGVVEEKKISRRQFTTGFSEAINLLKEQIIINSLADLRAISVRVVCPGVYFQKNQRINQTYLARLAKAKPQAPLHIDATLKEIRFIAKKAPKTAFFAISDSAFHTSLPKVAKYYAINKHDSDHLGIYRFGYHGLSVASIIKKMKDTGYLPEKIIICHLGGGASITALKMGRSIETSMGFTPLEGLVMATRAGNIDPSALFYLGTKKSLTYKNLGQYLNSQSGLLGLSGISSDIRTLLEKNTEEAKFALDFYANRVKKYIGSYIAALNGLDLLVFTGTVGYRSDPMRAKIIHNLNQLHLELDTSKNKNLPENGYIHKDNSIPILVAKTNEMGIIAEETIKLLNKS